jgi:hypothetical protein
MYLLKASMNDRDAAFPYTLKEKELFDAWAPIVE